MWALILVLLNFCLCLCVCLNVCVCVLWFSPLCVLPLCTVSVIWIPVRCMCEITPHITSCWEARSVIVGTEGQSGCSALLLVSNTAPTWVTVDKYVFHWWVVRACVRVCVAVVNSVDLVVDWCAKCVGQPKWHYITFFPVEWHPEGHPSNL